MTTQATSLSPAARRESIPSVNIDASAGVADQYVFATPLRTTLKGVKAICTEAFATEGCTVQIGTPSSAGAYGTIALTTANMAALGDAVSGTLTSTDVEGNVVIVIDQTLKSGAGEYIVQLDYEHNEAGA